MEWIETSTKSLSTLKLLKMFYGQVIKGFIGCEQMFTVFRSLPILVLGHYSSENMQNPHLNEDN